MSSKFTIIVSGDSTSFAYMIYFPGAPRPYNKDQRGIYKIVAEWDTAKELVEVAKALVPEKSQNGESEKKIVHQQDNHISTLAIRFIALAIDNALSQKLIQTQPTSDELAIRVVAKKSDELLKSLIVAKGNCLAKKDALEFGKLYP